MTAMSLKQFTGMLPRIPDHLLPDSAAAYASNCDFSRSVLAPLKDGRLEADIGGLIRGMYTDDGLHWYTWPTEVTAYRSPVINEIYNRLYYIEVIGLGGVFRVSPTPESVFYDGGVPNQVWAVGVPNPVVAPVLTLLDRTSLADYPSASIEFKAWYGDGTLDHGVSVVAATAITPWVRYQFAPPPLPADSPAGAVLVVQATATEGTKRLFQMDSATNSVAPAASAALPGGITMSVEVGAPGAYFINFSWGVVETRAYIYTETNTWDEESGPSPVSLISPTYLQDVRVTMTHPDFATFRPRKQANIYRTYGGSQYIRAGFTPNPTDVIWDDTAHTVQSAVGTALQSLSWQVPPVGIHGLVLAPNGWFAAFKENMLYMSEPYRPHVWPYSMTFTKAITGICVGSQSIVVTTREATYIVTGPHPASVTSTTVPIPVGGISQLGMCVVEGGVAFLSHDGIVIVEGSQASLDVGQRYFTRETWRKMFGAELPNMTLAYHDGCVVATSRNTPLGFILELDEAEGAMTRFDEQFTCMMRLPVLDTLYYAKSGKIYEFRGGTPMILEWTSKQLITPEYTKFGVGFARMSGTGQILVLLYADGAFLHQETLNALDRTKYFRLPSHPGSLKWQVTVSMGEACALEDLAFAHSPEELKQV